MKFIVRLLIFCLVLSICVQIVDFLDSELEKIWTHSRQTWTRLGTKISVVFEDYYKYDSLWRIGVMKRDYRNARCAKPF